MIRGEILRWFFGGLYLGIIIGAACTFVALKLALRDLIKELRKR
jgi:uncharacterized membrane protein YdjX (TVP38/TMEM64 family)